MWTTFSDSHLASAMSSISIPLSLLLSSLAFILVEVEGGTSLAEWADCGVESLVLDLLVRSGTVVCVSIDFSARSYRVEERVEHV
jgi:hypothetical protein